MNTANLQLEGLYLVLASLNNALVSKGLMSRDEVDAALRVAEDTALSDERQDGRSPANQEAIAFPARLLRMANRGAGDVDIQSFSELARLVGQQDFSTANAPSEPEPDETETLFHSIPGGDQWFLIEDVGGRRFVRHVPNRASNGEVEITDLEAFREREPHSIQNERLEELLASEQRN